MLSHLTGGDTSEARNGTKKRSSMPLIPFQKAVSDFRNLYDGVTTAMLNHALKLRGPNELIWLIWLINEFEQRYLKWETTVNANEGSRVIALLRANDVDRVTRLCGFAYLHICLDLPVVISRSLPNPFASKPLTLSSSTARRLYLALGPVLEAVYKNGMSAGAIPVTPYRVADWLVRHVSARIDPEVFRVLAYWVIMLRTASWLHADTHRELSKTDQVQYESALAACIETAVDKAKKTSFWKVLSVYGVPIFTMGFLTIGAIVMFVSAPVIAQPTDNGVATLLSFSSAILPILAGLAGAFFVDRIIHRYVQVARANALGKLVFTMLATRNTGSDEYSFPKESRD